MKQPLLVAGLPWPWKLELVENAESHGRALSLRIALKAAGSNATVRGADRQAHRSTQSGAKSRDKQ
jgi:hypothetical protein